jgi:WD40 repeat protein
MSSKVKPQKGFDIENCDDTYQPNHKSMSPTCPNAEVNGTGEMVAKKQIHLHHKCSENEPLERGLSLSPISRFRQDFFNEANVSLLKIESGNQTKSSCGKIIGFTRSDQRGQVLSVMERRLLVNAEPSSHTATTFADPTDRSESWDEQILLEIDRTKQALLQTFQDDENGQLYQNNGDRLTGSEIYYANINSTALSPMILNKEEGSSEVFVVGSCDYKCNSEMQEDTLQNCASASSDPISKQRLLTSFLDNPASSTRVDSIDITDRAYLEFEESTKNTKTIDLQSISSLHDQQNGRSSLALLEVPLLSPNPPSPLQPPAPSNSKTLTTETQKENDECISSLPESPLSDSPEKWYRKSHLVIENDDTGEGLNVVAIAKLAATSESKHSSHLSESFKKSLLDEEQSTSSDRNPYNDSFLKKGVNGKNSQQAAALVESSSMTSIRPLLPRPPLSSTVQQRPKFVESKNTVTSEEKKDLDDEVLDRNSNEYSNRRHARFASQGHKTIRRSLGDEGGRESELRECLSATESEVASLDGLPSNLQDRLLELGTSPRERILQSLDGIFSLPNKRNKESPSETPVQPVIDADIRTATIPRRVVIGGGKLRHDKSKIDAGENDNAATCGGIFLDTCVNLSGFWGGNIMEDDRLKCGSKGQWDTSAMKQQLEVPLAILDCTNIIHQEERVPPQAPRVHSSFVRVAGDYSNSSYAETIFSTEADPRMQDWIANQYVLRDRPPRDGSYHLGQSRTVIVHEMNRGNWTWCTAWSPDGSFLAVATDNHQLAVVDTTSSSVWRVRHDQKIKIPQESNTTRSIRSIAWGTNYIATGGTGNVVSILSPVEPFDILHDITATGFVGCLHWRGESNVLAIGSRLDFVLIVRIHESDEDSTIQGEKQLRSDILHKIDYKYWVNCVKFSTDGCCLAVGDAGGIVSVYDYEESGEGVETHMITWFKRKDSILSIEWSPDGKWLYAGGEDCSVTVVDTTYWEIVHRIGQDRWVQCIASSYGGSHVAIGGVSSEISILDVENGWDSVMGIELKGLVPLSAAWHPRDQYLVLTGQDNSVLAVETTNARHVKGHHLHSISPIRAIEFSPDGRMAVVGNEAGVVTFFSLSGTSFITAYELVTPLNKSVCIQWSLNGLFIVVGSMSGVVIVSRRRNKRQGQNCPPNASGFSVKKVIGDIGTAHAVSIDFQSQYIAVSGDYTRILDVRDDFSVVLEWKNGPYYANAWSPDGRWLALMGKEKYLTIYDTSSKRIERWRAIFSMKCDFVGRALAWGPLIIGGLLYLAYGGDGNEIYIMEIRTQEGTWETVLKVRRDASINTLDWSMDGLLAAGVGNGTVCIVDLSYLQSGVAVNEMDYNWQRQALTCFTEIRRNRGVNSIKSLRWLPAAPGSDRLLAVGGTDGEVEIIDLTERRRCKGYSR